MNTNINPTDIDTLEQELITFTQNWEKNQSFRSLRWRQFILIGFLFTLIISFLMPQLWWIGLGLIAYSAGSLFRIIGQEAKTNSQILEYKRQIQLARYLLEKPIQDFR